MDRNKDGLISVLRGISVIGIFWKCARIGERLSPYVSIFCIAMAPSVVVIGTLPPKKLTF
ncbi:uncharacterized protein A1O5_04761 [Cladophialophora psammophila CBS 110553]|uniref:Uncharacterized protein n=1 Tax=Cladophialophora psammophila CBS 110553 TaxID=1182543 RepID=W9WVM7_9EURO|nr:uncharacterized protein A1O5_04761 [Cladophialophora psammophila CBS 110553]EXJ72257.1 hypothetical protein A1O5_04761 [Cladophialophora psammophila CBS 110553]